LANAEIGAADVILAVGTKLGVSDFANQNPKLLDPRRQILIQLDLEPRNDALFSNQRSWHIPTAERRRRDGLYHSGGNGR
jgi:hypothetical protein